MKDKIELIIINTIVIIAFIIICLFASKYLTKQKIEKKEITQEITNTQTYLKNTHQTSVEK